MLQCGIYVLEIITFMKQYLCTGDFFANLFDDFGWLLGYYYIRLLFASYEKSAFSLDSTKNLKKYHILNDRTTTYTCTQCM